MHGLTYLRFPTSKCVNFKNIVIRFVLTEHIRV
jgi:hypothetical protein